jgi:hypothetical protein
MDITEERWKSMYWTNLVQVMDKWWAYVKTVTNLPGFLNFLAN